MKSAYSFARWSHLSQGESSRDSLRRQTDSAVTWIASYGKGYVLSTERFISAGESGYTGKHIAVDEQGNALGALERFIQHVEKKEIKSNSILLIDSYDRFSRLKPTRSLALFMRVISTGIGLVFTGSYEKRIINESLLDKEPNVLQFIIGEMIRSHMESAEKSRKVTSALQAKKNFMRAGNVVPYNNIPKYFSFDNINRKYAHNKHTPVVMELIEGILAGKSLYSMADDLNARKVKTFRRGFEWSANSVRAILRNRTLIGEFLGNKDYVPPLIDVNKFNQIQTILNNNTAHRGLSGNAPNIFKTLCFCADVNCGKTMQVSTQVVTGSRGDKRKYRYLRCSRVGKNVLCKNRHYISLDDIEINFFNGFLEKNPLEVLNVGSDKERAEMNDAISSLQVRLTTLDTNIDTTVELIGSVPNEELRQKLLKLNKERELVKTELDVLTYKIASFNIPPETRDFDTAYQYWDAEKKEERWEYSGFDVVGKTRTALSDNATRSKIRLMLQSLIGKITVDTIEKKYFVYNRMGNIIYESIPFTSKRNNSDVWRKSLKRKA